jgi:hypothetical protein
LSSITHLKLGKAFVQLILFTADKPKYSMLGQPNLNDREPVWALDGFDIANFYAAAYYLSKTDRDQEHRKPDLKNRSLGVHPAADLEKQVLEDLALLFARVKSVPSDGRFNAMEPTTPQHVTAAAMVYTGGTLVEIHIAKNDGAQMVDEMHDDELRQDLQKWFNADITQTAKTDEWMLNRIEKF